LEQGVVEGENPVFDTDYQRFVMRSQRVEQILNNLLNDESGQDLIEYALVAALIALGAVTVMKGVATNIGTIFTGISTNLTNA